MILIFPKEGKVNNFPTIRDIRTWVNWRNNVDKLCLTSFSLLLSMLCSNLDNSTEKPLQNNIGRETGRYQSSVTQVECPWL